jgi:hypothetical protein
MCFYDTPVRNFGVEKNQYLYWGSFSRRTPFFYLSIPFMKRRLLKCGTEGRCSAWPSEES